MCKRMTESDRQNDYKPYYKFHMNYEGTATRNPKEAGITSKPKTDDGWSQLLLRGQGYHLSPAGQRYEPPPLNEFQIHGSTKGTIGIIPGHLAIKRTRLLEEQTL